LTDAIERSDIITKWDLPCIC